MNDKYQFLDNLFSSIFDASEFRVRVKKGIVDDVFPGMFEIDVRDDASDSEIKTAVKLGILSRETIRVDTGAFRNVLVYLNRESVQSTPRKRFFKRILDMFKRKNK